MLLCCPLWGELASETEEQLKPLFSLSYAWACGPPIGMKIASKREASTIELAWNGKDRGHSGSVEAVVEFGLGRVIEPICVRHPLRERLVARDGV